MSLIIFPISGQHWGLVETDQSFSSSYLLFFVASYNDINIVEQRLKNHE